MWATVHARLGPRSHPDPAGGAAFVAVPFRSAEHARRREDVEVAFGARHASGAGVPRHFHQFGCPFVVRAVGPGAWQLAVLVTMLRTTLHFRHATASSRFGIRSNRVVHIAQYVFHNAPDPQRIALRWPGPIAIPGIHPGVEAIIGLLEFLLFVLGRVVLNGHVGNHVIPNDPGHCLTMETFPDHLLRALRYIGSDIRMHSMVGPERRLEYFDGAIERSEAFLKTGFRFLPGHVSKPMERQNGLIKISSSIGLKDS